MRNPLPKLIDHRLKELKETLPVDTFIELNKLSLIMRIEDDPEHITDLCRKYRDILNNHFNQ